MKKIIFKFFVIVGFLLQGLVARSGAVDQNVTAKNLGAQYVAIVKKGIQSLDREKVLTGLESLCNLDTKAVPLSSLFDLATAMRHGREDFLTLDMKHLFSYAIYRMVKHTHQWNQGANVNIAVKTQEELIYKLDQLIDLLDPTKEPCVTSRIRLENTKALVNQLSRAQDNNEDKLDKRLSSTIDTVREIKQFFNDVKDNVGVEDVDPIAGSLKILGLIYNRVSTKIFEGIKNFNERTIVLQLTLVDEWRKIALRQPTENFSANALDREDLDRLLGGLLQYFEKSILGEESMLRKASRKLSDWGKRLRNKIKNKNAYRERLVAHVVKSIKEIEESHERQNIIEPLRKIAFYALADLYTQTAKTSVKCEILHVFGEMAAQTKQEWLQDKSLEKLIATRGSEDIETASDKTLSNHIGAIALMNLIWVVWPADIKKNEAPVVLSLSSSDVQGFSQKWQLPCTAVEALLRFDHSIHQDSQQQDVANTPISDFLDLVGQEYRLVPLFVNRLRLKPENVTELRTFLANAKAEQKEKSLVEDNYSFERLAKTGAVRGKQYENKQQEETRELSRTTHESGKRNSLSSKEEEKALKKFNKEKLKEKEIRTQRFQKQRDSITKWLKSALELQDKECDILLDFLQEINGKSLGNESGIPYSEHTVRPILDKLIHRFYLTQPERELINKAIFQAQGKTSNQTSFTTKLAVAIKSFFGQTDYPKIACSFNNFEKIKMIVKIESRLNDSK